MSKKPLRLLLLFLAAGFLWLNTPAPARAAKWAVIVGINNYGDTIKPLKHSISDAESFRDTLQDIRVAGVPPDHVRLLTSDASDPSLRPTRDNITRALREIGPRASGAQDQFWFYFAGHGQDKDAKSYLLPMDFKVGDLEGTALRTKLIRDMLQKECPHAQKVIILDACHSGSSRSAAPAARPEVEMAGTGMITITACKVDEVAYEFPDTGGVFTYYLRLGLSGAMHAARSAGRPMSASLVAYSPGITQGRVKVTIADLNSYLTTQVAKKVESEALDVQTPQVLTQEPLTNPVTTDDPQAPAAIPPRAAAQLTAKEPLGPALIVSLTDKRTLPDGGSVTSQIAETMATQQFVSQNFPLLDKNAARQFHEMLDIPDAASQAAKKGARFLILGEAETSANKMDGLGGLVTVTATITAKLIDDQGNVLDAATVSSDPQAGGTEVRAATKALQQAVDALVSEISPKVAAALGSGPGRRKGNLP